MKERKPVTLVLGLIGWKQEREKKVHAGVQSEFLNLPGLGAREEKGHCLVLFASLQSGLLPKLGQSSITI